MSIKFEIENLIEKAIGKKAAVEMPDNFSYGDFSTNVAIKEKLSPQEVADKLKISPLFEKVEVVNGFINLFLKPEYFLENLKQILKQKEKYGQSQIGKGKTIIIDYSGPNIAKPFGIGHLRSTIIGQAIYNLYKFLGYKTIGDNHLGDWGTQFGKLIYKIELGIKNQELRIEELTIGDLEKLYVEFHKEAEQNPVLNDEARAWFKKLEEGDKKAKEIWQACKEISLKEFDRIYNLLGIKIDNTLGESFYENKMRGIEDEMLEKKFAFINTEKPADSYNYIISGSRGTTVATPTNLPPIVSSRYDKTASYLLRDLATVKYRLKKWKPSIIVYEVGVDQSLYFKQLFQLVEDLGWASKDIFFHVAHGLMRSKTGKFSTRRGDTVHLEDVLQEAIDKAKEIINNSETDKNLPEKEKNQLAKQIGIGAVKYNDLSQHHSRDIVFDWDKIINLKGNSGPYLQYAFARTQSVLEKSYSNRVAVNSKIDFKELQEIEKIILKKFLHFSEVVEQAANSFSPNLICNYIFNLSQSFNLFYNEVSILKADTKEQKEFRLALTFGVGQVIKNSLTLLGIESPNKM